MRLSGEHVGLTHAALGWGDKEWEVQCHGFPEEAGDSFSGCNCVDCSGGDGGRWW